MRYKKYVSIMPNIDKMKNSLVGNNLDGDGVNPVNSNYSSYLPEVYAGHPRRIERYSQYDLMDTDSEVNAALDTIADFSVQKNTKTDEYFQLTFHSELSPSEMETIKVCLRQWSKINDWKRRAWRIFRNVLKYGDQFFIRDPETLRWYWVDPSKVEKIIVNEADGKKPEAYVFKDLDFNLQQFTATAPDKYGNNLPGGQGLPRYQIPSYGYNYDSRNSGGSQSRFNTNINGQTVVDATHVVHISLSEGLDANWPFGTSILESVFKVFRQKELLEEAVIIYRIQRAPERRIFYIDIGTMNPMKANAYLERIKNEIYQRRFPTRNGTGANAMDATYNPMSMLEDFFFAQTSEGRGSRVETLPGGESLGQIDDLRYWNNRLIRGLRVPSSYLPTGPDDGTATYNDSRVGTSYIQEYRFAEYCERLQNLISTTFDDEFKLFLKRRNVNINASDFELNFNSPENFSSFAEDDRLAIRINNFLPLNDIPYLSKRYLQKYVLRMNDDELQENANLWREENRKKLKGTAAEFMGDERNYGLNAIGIKSTDLDPDVDNEPDTVDTEIEGDFDFDTGSDETSDDDTII